MLTLVRFFLDGDNAFCRTGLTFSIPRTKSSMRGDEPILIAFLILAVSTEVLLVSKFIDGLMISSLSGFLPDVITDVFPLLCFLSVGLFDEISSSRVAVSVILLDFPFTGPSFVLLTIVSLLGFLFGNTKISCLT